MKTLLVLISAMLLLTGCATATSSISSLGPYDVSGLGATYEQAKASAFRVAVEQAVGAALISERKTEDSVLVKNEVLTHSAGYVDRFEVLNVDQTNGKYRVDLRVYVKQSMVNDYILHTAKDSKNLEGGRIDAKLSTYMDERLSGDQLVDGILNSYPEKAFDINQDDIKIAVDDYRVSSLYISYTIRMNDKYLMALSDALKQVRDMECVALCGGTPSFSIAYFKNPKDWVVTRDFYFFNDISRPKHVTDVLFDNARAYSTQVVFYDAGDDVIDRYCFDEGKTPIWAHWNKLKYGIDGGTWKQSGVYQIELSDKYPLKAVLPKMKRVQLEIVKTTSCGK